MRNTTNIRSRCLGVAITALLACMCGLLPVIISTNLGLEFAALIGAMVLAVVIAVTVDVKRTGDLCSPLCLSGLFYLLAFAAGPVFFWFNPDFGQNSLRTLPFDHPALVMATGLCLLAWLGLAAGYFIRPFAFCQVPALKLERWSSPTIYTLFIMYGVGWVARLARIGRGEYFHGSVPAAMVPTTGSTLGQVLLILAVLPSIVVAYFGVIGTHSRSKWWLRGYRVGLGVEILYYVPSGGRSYVVTIAVLALIVAYYTKGRLPIRAIIVTGVLLLFVLFPLIHLYRESGTQAGFTSNAGRNLERSAAALAGQDVQQTLLYGVGATFSRFSDIFVPAALVYQGRQVYAIAPGETLVWAITNMIPKAVWPGKPSTGTFAGEFAQSIRIVPSKATSVATTQPGELFFNFGTVGVLVGMFFVGGVYREFGEWLRERARRPMVLALYATVAYSIIDSQETIIAQGLTGLLRTTAVLAFILWATQQFALLRHRSPVLPQGS